MSPTDELPEDFGARAAKLERLLDKWRKAELSEGVPEFVLKLTSYVNKLAKYYHIIGGAFGVANMEKNTFELFRKYPAAQERAQNREWELELFPYIEPAQSDLLTIVKESYRPDFVPEKFRYSVWMHNLFSIQRMQQRLETAKEQGTIIVPEYYGILAKEDRSLVVVTPKEIRGVIAKWLDIWEFACHSPDGFDQIVEDVTNTHGPAEDSQVGMYESIKALRPGSSSPQRALFDTLPENEFFFHPTNDSSALLARELLRTFSFETVRTAIGVKRNYETLNDGVQPGNTTTLAVLAKLHGNATFPIVPYLFLKLLDRRELSHCIVPLLKTTAFPVRVKLESGLDSELSPYGMVMVATIEGSPTEEQLFPLVLLMRLAGEPFADYWFYGGSQRRLMIDEGARSSFRDFFRSLTHEIGPLQQRLLSSWLIPFSEISLTGSGSTDVDNFRVITIPKVYRIVGDRFALWTNKGWLGRMEITDGQAFPDVLRILARSALENVVASENAKSVEKRTLRDVAEAKEMECDWENLVEEMTLRLKFEGISTLRGLQWWIGSNEDLDEIATHFCRLVIAVTTNSFKHCRSGYIMTTVTFDSDKSILTVIQMNRLERARAVKPAGTKTVMEFLVDLMNGDRSTVRFGFDESEQCWVSRFTVPAPFVRAKPEKSK